MNIIRYNPSNFTSRSSQELASWRNLFDFAFQLPNSTSAGWNPSLDVYEDADKVTVQLELAGLKKEDFDISLEEDVLTISGERKPAAATGSGETFRRERVYGTFRRSVTLPTQVKSDQVKATYQDGILTVALPKAEEAKPRKINVELN